MFRLREAYENAKSRGLVKGRGEFADSLWCNKRGRNAYVNFLNLERGKTKTIEIEMIPKICKKLGISADYLFGISNNNDVDYRDEVLGKAKEIIDIAKTL